MRANARSKRADSFFRVSFTIVATFILLLQFPAHDYAGESTRLRPAHITVLVDREWLEQNKKSDTQEIQDIINFVSEIFKKDFDLSFITDAIKPFDFFLENDEINLDANLTTIKQAADTDYQKSDIVLGFTAKKQFRCILRDHEGNIVLNNEKEETIVAETPCPQKNKLYYDGMADQPGITAISKFNKLIALHEVGHLFGAQHISDSEFVMNPYANASAAFDTQNKEIIKQRIKEKFSIPGAP